MDIQRISVFKVDLVTILFLLKIESFHIAFELLMNLQRLILYLIN